MMIYAKYLKQKIYEAKVIAWYMKPLKRNRTLGAKIILVWWEYNGSKRGCYDLFHFVGNLSSTSIMDIDVDSRIIGGFETLPPNTKPIGLFKRAYKLERKLERIYHEYQASQDDE